MHTKWKNSSVGKLFLALGINFVILALTQIFATSYFALYDDVVMNDIAAGYYRSCLRTSSSASPVSSSLSRSCSIKNWFVITS